MGDLYHINQEIDIPIYQQIVDVVKAAIETGDLEPGDKLPTVRELSDRLDVARGTVKRAYDELETLGLLEKARGKGSFVSKSRFDLSSRKDRAMASIDHMFNNLESMNFSTSEINIFLNLKMRERLAKYSNIKIGIVECTPEVLAQLSDQLRVLSRVDIYTYLLDDVERYPYKLSEDMDLVLTTDIHANALRNLLPREDKLLKVAVTPDPICIKELFAIKAGSRLGIVAESDRYAAMLLDICANYTLDTERTAPSTFKKEEKLGTYLRDKDVLVIPYEFQKYASKPQGEDIKAFASSRPVILLKYKIDAGSYMYLTDRIQDLREKLI